MPRPTFRLGLACDNRCVFCAQRGLEDEDEAPLADRLNALRATADALTFVGGEPLLDSALSSAIVTARALHFGAVGVQTNGRRLGQPGVAAALAQAGLTDVHVSLHGAEAPVHDYHTGVAGSFAALSAGVVAARAAGLTVVATTVLTRSNFRALARVPRLLRELDVAAWLISVPRVAGAAAAAFDRVVPRLGLALPFALQAVDAATRLGLPTFLDGAPLCALGPFAARALAPEPRAYAPVCEACPARPACPGVDPIYLARFGGDELSSRARPAATAPAAFTELFVGAGELAPAAPSTSSSRRVALPIAGKVQPARAEVAATAPRKSGDALREIFPALFESAVHPVDPTGGTDR